MHVAGVESVGDRTTRLREERRHRADPPVAGQRPVVAPQLRGRVHVALIRYDAAGRGEAGGTAISDVGLRGTQAGPVGRRFDTGGLEEHEALVDVDTGLAQEHLEDHLGFLVLALTEVVVPDPTLGVGEVQRWPVVVVECPPDRVVVVHRHRIGDVHLRDGAVNVVEVALELELGSLHPDDDEPVSRVLVRPCPHVRQRADPVDARVGAEADQRNSAAKIHGRQWRRVQPRGRPPRIRGAHPRPGTRCDGEA